MLNLQRSIAIDNDVGFLDYTCFSWFCVNHCFGRPDAPDLSEETKRVLERAIRGMDKYDVDDGAAWTEPDASTD